MFNKYVSLAPYQTLQTTKKNSEKPFVWQVFKTTIIICFNRQHVCFAQTHQFSVRSFEMIWIRMVDQMNRWILVKSGFIGSFNLPWSEWSRITDPDQDHLKGTHPLISKKVARNVSANHKEELCKTRTITELSPQSVETVQNATRSSNR